MSNAKRSHSKPKKSYACLKFLAIPKNNDAKLSRPFLFNSSFLIKIYD